MAGFGGLAFVGEGYDQGAADYWRRRNLEIEAEGASGFGKWLRGVGAPGMLPGAQPMPGPPPSMFQPPGQAPGGGSQPPQMTMPNAQPMPGGPSPGMVNPGMLAGQPQNLTGPIIPPGGFGGPPGGAAPPAGAPPMSPQGRLQGPSQGMGGGMTSGPGSMWIDIGRKIAAANPNISDAGLAAAISKAMPLMNAESQQNWRNVELELRREHNQLLGLQIGQRGAIAGQQETGRNYRAELAADLRREAEAGREQRAELSAATRTTLGQLSAQTRLEIADRLEAGREQRAELSAQARKEIAGMNAQARKELTEFLEEGRTTRQERGIGAAGTRQERGIEAAGARQDKAIGAAAERQQTGIAAKQAPGIVAGKSAIDQIDSVFSDITDSQKGGTTVTGVQGMLNRWKEWGQGAIGQEGETRATVFESKVRTLQAQVPRLLAGVGRISAEERAQIDKIVRGLSTFTDPKAAIDSLQYLKQVIQSKAPAGAVSGRPAQRSSQQPVEPPPIDKLAEGRERTIRHPDGSTHTWILRNGEPVEVRGAEGGSEGGPPPQQQFPGP